MRLFSFNDLVILSRCHQLRRKDIKNCVKPPRPRLLKDREKQIKETNKTKQKKEKKTNNNKINNNKIQNMRTTRKPESFTLLSPSRHNVHQQSLIPRVSRLCTLARAALLMQKGALGHFEQTTRRRYSKDTGFATFK